MAGRSEITDHYEHGDLLSQAAGRARMKTASIRRIRVSSPWHHTTTFTDVAWRPPQELADALNVVRGRASSGHR